MTTRDQFSIFNIFSPLGLLTILFLCSMSCSNRVEEKNANTREGLPDQESWKVTITLTDHGTIRSIVRSGHLEKYDDKQFILLDQRVNSDFFNEEENHTTNLKSELAEIEEGNDFMRAMGNVIVVSDSGVTLYTDTLVWDSKEELIYTEDNVMLTTEKGDTLYGIGFESDIAMENWRIIKPSGVTAIKEDEQ
ncbi:MAG: LPS export ABC transporter periplasmic protein LptC [Candidatus Marinimicrobia bacterium]|jgi:LPS export ABC transporter protein LptC|nr:LPS export ABC transporter periplasmic protein LptC [Candidatus Neomarinimicrobiota bacterium]MDP6499246.1 LPS export ABC transporter periplasmic protein LptC [Candidatus Neomarinimicrobiota bacterium]MDP6725675.1 LPS export ABC transporter periplasmic protein LptC [Candidatus Neomarinimicrobiota bacterium]|tara:strand:+ start:6528 stop:7103 length:576 start_codon:yes stop_codon:yes gene_type:complete